MTTTTIDKDRARLKALLHELFQFDAADLDFGIYRILNMRRDEIEQFIEKDLLDAVDEALDQFQHAAVVELKEELEEKRQGVINSLGVSALDEHGDITEQFRGTPAATEYLRARRALEETSITDATRRRIFNDLYRFFNRYYDQGDFLTERRYSSREPKYAIPYNGEEVVLHWANRGQYYVKSTERHTDYRFTVDDCTIWFKLTSAQEPNDNVKGDTRYFILADPGSEHFSTSGVNENELVIPFEYRPLTEEEADEYLAIYNARQSKRDRRKTLDRSRLVQAMEIILLDTIEQPDLNQTLARPHRPAPESPSILAYHLNRYTARNTMDYFVHKDLGRFLQRELDYFLKNEVLHIDDVVGDPDGELTRHTFARMRAIRHIARRIISFLAQIEDFQKRLFEKKKFVVHTDYCITLDRVPEYLYPEILDNLAQLNEWRQLYAIDRWEEDLFWNGTFDQAFLRTHPHMMVDTRFFDDDFKARLLATFDDLDGATDGLLIHGENFQAQRLLCARHEAQVKCIYLDPPYNTGASKILYKNDFEHSSWLSMMHNRLEESQAFLEDSAVLIIAIDDYEMVHLSRLLDQLYEQFERHIVIVNHHPQGSGGSNISRTHEYALFIVPKGQELLKGRILEDEVEYRPFMRSGRGENNFRYGRPNSFYALLVEPDTLRIVGTEPPPDLGDAYPIDETETGLLRIYPIGGDNSERVWRRSYESGSRAVEEGKIICRESFTVYMVIEHEERRAPVYSNWVDRRYNAGTYGTNLLANIFGETVFSYPKSLYTVLDSIEAATHDAKDGIVLDYFAGSGTTGHAVIELNRQDVGARKYILVEMGNYFHTALKPRIQKVVFTNEWKDGVPQNSESGVSHMFKYQSIESYEDALNNVIVQRPQQLTPELFPEQVRREYMLHYLLDAEIRRSPTLAPEGAFNAPFDYRLLIQHGHQSPRPTTIDLVETFHYLIGMNVRRLERHQHQDRRYVVSRGSLRTEHGIEQAVVIWRNTEGLELKEEARWVNEDLLTEPPDRVYVNGESFIANAEPLEHTFRNRMLDS